MAIEIRNGPEGSPNEGAYEKIEGVDTYFTVLGRKLQVGDEIFFQETDGMMGDTWLGFGVNGFGTNVCHDQARQYQRWLGKISPKMVFFGFSNEPKEVMRQWKKENNITYPVYSTENTDNGIKLGVTMAEAEYRYNTQRSLFGVVNRKVVYAEYVYDQGGPLPNFEAGIEAVRKAAGI